MLLKISPRFAALFLVIFFSCSRNPKNMVSFVKNFTDVIQTHQNLIFTFSHDMVGEDELGKWDSAEYIKISPKVPGRFRWSNTKELIFSPAVGFNPSTKYSAEFTGTVLKEAKDEKLFIGKEYKKLDFHTEYLQPTEVNAFWAKGKGGNGVVIRLGLNFNYEVDPGQLKDRIKVDIGGKNVSFTMDNTSPAKEIFVTINGNPFGKDQSLINVKFLEGIKISGGEYATDGKFELAQVLAPRTDLEILSVQSGFKDNQGFVRVITS
ncbi:MAG TPA: hypothetical protein VEC12_08325, partial [Bacteroidia bacterium]|nr:hypothetical protein [Bacteroidia bacterium]